MVGKQIELATQTVPGATKIGIVFNPGSADATNQQLEASVASSVLDIKLVAIEVGSPDQLEAAFQRLAREEVQAAVVLYDALFFQERHRLADLAASRRLPAIYAARDHVVAGGLISYGISLSASARRLAGYIDRIFKGTHPGELPLEFPTKLELIINLKAAQAIGVTFPPTLLAIADELIE